jgi:adenylate cyclase
MPMNQIQQSRRLAAVMAADVVGYSRMMASDETGTLKALKDHRETFFDPLVAAHHGRIVKLIGDGTLVEFSSVVDAVNCALAVQQAIGARSKSDSSQFLLRIGINLGDVIIEGDDIYGDGVNVAARIEALSDPGGICVSSIVNESVGGRTGATFVDGGDVVVKNIDRPIHIWKWHPDAGPVENEADRKREAEPLREQASIAVLPFNNMSGDPEQEYFSDGICEDIITDLSKVSGLLVIARNSSFAYKGKSVDIRTVGRQLGVTSLLEGSVRRAGNKLRITAQLIDATNGAHLWGERFDRDLTDIFAVQDEVTQKIVTALKVKLTPAEARRLTDGATRSVEAHDLFLRGRELVFGSHKNKETFRQSVALLKGAIALDPDYGAPFGALAMSYCHDFQNRWSDDPDQSLKIAIEYAEEAIGKAPNDAFGHYVLSIVAAYSKDFERAEAASETALELGPNFALAVNAHGVSLIYRGEYSAATTQIERAMRLDPGFSQQYLHFLGMAHLLAGKFEVAAAEFRERIRQVPETDISRAYLASALGYLGEIEEAKSVWAEMKAINPNYSFEGHMSRTPFRRVEDIELVRKGLQLAGIVGDAQARTN